MNRAGKTLPEHLQWGKSSGASPGAALEDGLVPSWHRRTQTQSRKVALQQQSPRKRACSTQR